MCYPTGEIHCEATLEAYSGLDCNGLKKTMDVRHGCTDVPSNMGNGAKSVMLSFIPESHADACAPTAMNEQPQGSVTPNVVTVCCQPD